MKKLTAGILATLIGLVSANSADASVASTNYVKGALAEKQDTLNTTNVIADPNASSGKFVTSVTAENGTVTVSYGNPDAAKDASETEAGVMKLYGGVGQNTDGTMTQQAITNALGSKQGELDATNVVVDPSTTGSFVTSVTAADGVITISKGDVAYDEQLNDTSTNGVQNKVINAAIDLKQDKLNSGAGGNITVQGQEGDNVVTGISAANGVVTVTTGYFDHTDTKIADEVTADITQQQIEVDQDNTQYPNAASYSLIKYVDATGNASYKWELIDRVYTE